MMPDVKPALALLVNDDKLQWLTPLLGESCELHSFSELREAVKTLSNIRYDMIVLDDTLFANRTRDVIVHLKRRFPTIPSILLTANQDPAYQADMITAGADDFLTRRMTKEKLQHHIQIILRQHQQNRELIQLNRNLHALSSLSSLLHTASDNYTLILRAIRLITNTFRLHGVAVLLPEGDVLRLYAGSDEINSRNRLYESILRPEECDPFLWTFQNRVTQLFSDIAKHRHFVPVPILSEAEAAAIIPLVHQEGALGVMGIFAPKGKPLSHNDLIIYEQLSAQITSALYNVQQHQSQHESIQSNQHLLRAWHVFANLNNVEDIAKALCSLVDEIGVVRHACVWLDMDGSGDLKGTCIDSDHGEVPDYLATIHEAGFFDLILPRFANSLQPVLYKPDLSTPPQVRSLLDALQVQVVAALPITNASGMVGGILAGIAGEDNYDEDNIRLMENLAHTAGRALERIMLTAAIHERNVRLETILRTISEGIFFVDDENRVAFCNPQVAELTSVPASKVIGQPVDVLLKTLASATSEAAKTYAQLQAAKNVVSSPDYQRDEYPIVELPFVGLERSLYLEFVKFDGPGNQKINWIGALRSTARSAHLFKTPDVMFNTMIESLRVPSLQLRSLAATLSEQHGHLSYRERDQLLRQLEADLERVNLLWNNFQEIYALENNTLALNREQADLADLLRRVLEARPLNRFQRSFVVDAPPLLPTVRLDEFRMERALADVLQRALDVSPPDTQIAVRITNHEHELRLTVEDNGPALRPEQVDQIFEPWSITRDRAASGFGLYVARELVRRHGGRTWVEARHPNGAAITIALPVAAAAPRLADEPPPVYADAVLVDADLTPRMRPAGLPAVAVAAAAAAMVAPPPAVETPPRSAPIRAPQRSPSTVMIVLGASSLTSALRDALEKQNYDLLVYQRADEALEDVTATRLDLIVIDAAPGDINGLELCARMRKRTEVPIMLVADNASDQEKVLGFRAGADEYVTRPVSDEELMARVQAIFKRQQIPERTSEPLVVGNLIVDVARREVLLNGAPVELTRIEFDLLHLLISNRNRVLTHRQLLEKVWGPDYEDETHYLWVNISRLRKKLEPTPDSPRYIHTQPGIGYYFDEL